MQCSEGAFGACSAPTTCSPSNNSFYDAGPHADAEVERILQKGFTQELKSWEDLVAELGPDVVVDKLGCVLKVKISGNIKARLVTDLRRPGGNGRLKIRERVVLPRVLDLVYSILRLVEYWGDITLVELAAIDFSDAFHTIFLRMASAPLCVFEPNGKYYIHQRLPVGLASAPLVWGRLAAAACRLTQAMAMRTE